MTKLTVDNLEFDTYEGRTSSRKSKYSVDIMKGLVNKAIKSLNERKEQANKLTELLSKEKDTVKQNKLRERIAKLRAPISVSIFKLETLFGQQISTSDNIAWALNPKNPTSKFKDLVAESISGKLHVGAQLGKCKDKSLMSVNFRFSSA